MNRRIKGKEVNSTKVRVCGAASSKIIDGGFTITNKIHPADVEKRLAKITKLVLNDAEKFVK